MLDSTDWAVFTETCSDLEEMTEVVSAYVNFAADVCILKNSRPLVELMKRLPAVNTIKQLEREKKVAIDNGNKIPISHLRLVWSFSGFDGFLTVNCCHTKPDIIPEESRSRNIKEGWILVDEFSKHFFLKTTCYDPPGSGNVRRKYSELNTKEDGDVTELLTAVT
ncbi:uncharacterized protein [Apostichopus japonicus]|uniref:uncharacterized protein isoform X3 n=1 Tax=Stichopus japonicus TaxID=307972 RepID=UPI003AB42B5A